MKKNEKGTVGKAARRIDEAGGGSRCRSALPALDWFNGRRYPYADEFARGAIAGLS